MSGQPFKVTSSSPQPTTGLDVLPSFKSDLVATGQQIRFLGTLTNGVQSKSHDFVAIAGEGGPTVTGGFAKWNIIARPQRVGMTVLDGYDPITMDVPIVFDNVVNTLDAQMPVETAVQILEWMAGRGILFDGKVGHPGQGDSPLVKVQTVDGAGNKIPLVPLQYQTDDLNWIVTGLAWDGNPLRNEHGHRMRQKVTVTLTQHVGGPGTSYDSTTTRDRARRAASNAGSTAFKVTAQNNTIRKIVTFRAHNTSHAAAVETLQLNRSDKSLRLGPSVDADLTKHLPLGTKIRVPNHLIK